MADAHNVDFIDDGYTQAGYIAETKGIHGSLDFTYRPLLVEQRDAITEVTIRQGAAKGAKAGIAAVAQQVKSWSLKDKNSADVPVSAANVGKLRAPLFDKLYAVIAGHVASDLRPDATGEESADYIKGLLGEKSSVEADAKN